MKFFPAFILCAALSGSVLPASADGKHTPLAPPPASDSLAGIKIGMDRDDAHAALTAAGAISSSTDKDSKDKNADGKGKSADPDSVVPEVWTLKDSPYARIVFAADGDDKVLWVTAFARPGQGVPFAQIGNLARAAASGPAFTVWNVISPRGSFREIARGQGGKALVVSLLPFRSANPNGAFSPQIMPKQTMPKQAVPKQIVPKSAAQPPAAERPK